MSRLTIDISEEQHHRLKTLAALQRKTIRQYAIERLFPAPLSDERAWRELKDLLEQRIERGLAGEVSAATIDAIIDEELGSDEELGRDRRA